MDNSSNSGFGCIYTNSNIVFYKLTNKRMGWHRQSGWVCFSKYFFIFSTIFYYRGQSENKATIKQIINVHNSVRSDFRGIRNLSEPRLQSFSILRQAKHGTNSPNYGEPNICSFIALPYHSNDSHHLFSCNVQKKIP